MQNAETKSTHKTEPDIKLPLGNPAARDEKNIVAATAKNVTPIKESGIAKTKKELTKPSMKEGSVEILHTDLTGPFGNLKQDLCRSMTLIHSTANDLRSGMQEMLNSKESDQATWGAGAEKMRTVAFVASNINQLMRTQLKMMKEFRRVEENESGGK